MSLLAFSPSMIISDRPSQCCMILSYGSVLTGRYTAQICVLFISMPMHLPASISIPLQIIGLYLMPFLIKIPTPLHPLNACSLLLPIHSYPLIYISSFYFKCVSIIATTSGWVSQINLIIFLILAWIPLTLI